MPSSLNTLFAGEDGERPSGQERGDSKSEPAELIELRDSRPSLLLLLLLSVLSLTKETERCPSAASNSSGTGECSAAVGAGISRADSARCPIESGGTGGSGGGV